MGRFITPDPLGFIDGPNPYLYCLNDPVNYLDLWGLYEAGIGGSLNWAVEKIIGDEIGKLCPTMSKDIKNKAAAAIRKEMTADEYKKFKNTKIPQDEKAEMAKEIIKRVKNNSENREITNEFKPYLEKIFIEKEETAPKSKP